jgi:hypothetical protein
MKRVRYEKKKTKEKKPWVPTSSHEAVGGYNDPAYKPVYARTARFLCQRGAIRSELAEAFGVSTTAIDNWMVKHPEFGDAVHEGAHEMFDPRVERSLAEQAIGYYVDEEEVVVVGPQDDKYAEKITVRKYVKPNVTAAIFFLKNRLPAKYRDVHKFEVDTKELPSSDDLKAKFATMIQGLVEQGILAIPQKRIMKDVTPR